MYEFVFECYYGDVKYSTNYRHSKYPEKFKNVKEGKKSGPEIAYGSHSYGSLMFELSRFYCIWQPVHLHGFLEFF